MRRSKPVELASKRSIVYLHNNHGLHDKVYIVETLTIGSGSGRHYKVIARWGKRGASLRMAVKHRSRDGQKALDEANKIVASQTTKAKGYRIVNGKTFGKLYAPAALAAAA